MASIFSFVGGELPEPLKRLLMEADDPDKLQMRHDIQMSDRHAFWESLTRDQLRFLLLELTRVARDDDPGSVASELSGLAEGFMMVKFNSCGCGRKHRNPDDFLDELTNEANAAEEYKRELKELALEEITDSPFVPPHMVGQLKCTKCDAVFQSVDDRRADAIGSSHADCKDS